jgi:hypothetical protein
MSIPLRSRWLTWQPENCSETPIQGTLKTLKSGYVSGFDGFEGAECRNPDANFLPDAGELAAVKVGNPLIGDLWLVRDDCALAEHPDIIRSRLPVFFFDEIEQLRGKTPEELRAIGLVKAEFPTSRVLQ